MKEKLFEKPLRINVKPEYEDIPEFELLVYSPNQIKVEKLRSIHQRRKARDYYDVYFICRRFGIRLEDIEGCIVSKTNIALELYDKYRSNLKEKIALLQSGEIFGWGGERDLLLSEIDDTDFYSFLGEFQDFLKKTIRNFE